MYGGSYDTIRPSFEYGGSQGKWNYFMDGSYDQNGLGIENPTPSHNAIHDTTDQYKSFVYASRILSDTSRVSLMGSASYSNFQVPDTPGLTRHRAHVGDDVEFPRYVPATFDSSTLNENQNEQNYYGVVTYQKSAGDLNLQASVFGRNSDVHFSPDKVGDLYFNGEASDVARDLYSGGFRLTPVTRWATSTRFAAACWRWKNMLPPTRQPRSTNWTAEEIRPARRIPSSQQ